MLHAKARKLTFEEETTLAAAAQAGDVQARNELIAANIPLVLQIVRVIYANRGELYEDVVQEGCLGLMRAAMRWKPDKGVRFGTYAVWCIRSRLHAHLQAKSCREAPLTSLDFCEEDDRNLHEVLADGTDTAQELEGANVAEAVRERIERLPLSEREVTLVKLRWLSGDDSTLREVGEQLGFSRQYAKQVEDRAMAKLRRGLRTLAAEVAA